MNRTLIVALGALLALGWESRAGADDPMRAIEVSELHRTANAVLLSHLDDSDAKIAARTALAVGRTKAGTAVVTALLGHVRAEDPAVRAMSVYALGLQSDASDARTNAGNGDGARSPVRDALDAAMRDENSAVRYAAVDGIGRWQRDRPVVGNDAAALATRVLALATNDPNATVRGHAALQLDGFANAPNAVALVRAIERIEARDPNDDVRWHAAFVLYRAFAKRADASFLALALHDRNELVRVQTLRAYGKRADRATIPLVTASLDDPAWRVQFEAREALRGIAGRGRSEHLTSDPPGVHLPPISRAPIPYAVDVATLGIAPFEDVRAPDPATLPLSGAPLPVTAEAMNGPAPGPHPRVLIRTTRGDVVVRLYPEWAPSTVANFLSLASIGYFDGNRWFRIVPDFVTQTGDPTGDPDSDAGFTIPAEENPVEQRSGIIAMGLDYEKNRAVRDSAGTQFYFTLSPQPYLDRDFSVFGEIETGMDVVANLVERDRMLLVRRISDG